MARLTDEELAKLERHYGRRVEELQDLTSRGVLAALAEVREARAVDAAVIEAARVVAESGEKMAAIAKEALGDVAAERARCLAWARVNCGDCDALTESGCTAGLDACLEAPHVAAIASGEAVPGEDD